MGSHVGGLPPQEFVDPACGANGGPPGLTLGRFEEFKRCTPDRLTGLREVWFSFDDEYEYIARATRNAALITRNLANQVLGQPVVYSLLIDDDGRVQGYRVITDTRADTLVRLEAASLAIHFQTRFGFDGWECIDLPAAEGETPIGNDFTKKRCEKNLDGRKYTVESKYFLKAGQSLRDPHTRKPLMGEGEFESWARLEIYRLDAVRP